MFTVTQLDPLGGQGDVAVSAFFVSLFCGVSALLTFIFFFGAEVWASHNLGVKNFRIALRRGMLMGTMVTGVAVMRMFGLLGWAQGGLLIVFLSLVELICLPSQKK